MRAKFAEILLAVAFGVLLAVAVQPASVVYVNPPVCNLTLYPTDEQPEPFPACESKSNPPVDVPASEPKP